MQRLCLLCGESRFQYAGTIQKRRFERCLNCDLLQTPVPRAVPRKRGEPLLPLLTSKTIAQLRDYVGPDGKTVTIIGDDGEPLAHFLAGLGARLQVRRAVDPAALADMVALAQPHQFACDPDGHHYRTGPCSARRGRKL